VSGRSEGGKKKRKKKKRKKKREKRRKEAKLTEMHYLVNPTSNLHFRLQELWEVASLSRGKTQY
jgi:hypothetical protein